MAFDALVATGAYPEDARDLDANAVNDLETWREAAECNRWDVAQLAPIGDGDLVVIDRWLTAGKAVFFAMDVDEGYESLAGSAVYTGPTGPILGGHAQAIVGFTPAAYIVQNSWGTGWGDGGFGYLARSFVESSTRDLVAMLGGPVFA